jgi:hypothetical protein
MTGMAMVLLSMVLVLAAALIGGLAERCGGPQIGAVIWVLMLPVSTVFFWDHFSYR